MCLRFSNFTLEWKNKVALRTQKTTRHFRWQKSTWMESIHTTASYHSKGIYFQIKITLGIYWLKYYLVNQIRFPSIIWVRGSNCLRFSLLWNRLITVWERSSQSENFPNPCFMTNLSLWVHFSSLSFYFSTSTLTVSNYRYKTVLILFSLLQ